MEQLTGPGGVLRCTEDEVICELGGAASRVPRRYLAAPRITATRGRSAPLASVALLVASAVAYPWLPVAEPELRGLLVVGSLILAGSNLGLWLAERPGLVLLGGGERPLWLDPALLGVDAERLAAWLEAARQRPVSGA